MSHNPSDKNNMNSNNKMIYTAGFYFCLLLLLLGLLAAFFFLYNKSSRKQTAPGVENQDSTASESTTLPEESSTQPKATTPTHPTILPENMTSHQKKIYKKLLATREEYPDTYAYIDIPETNVSYPILQSQTEEDYDYYYLDHCIDGQEGLPGTIFTCGINERDFSDFNTVIYGHNMIDESMFGSLKHYSETEYLQSHPDVYIYTPEGASRYKIFAAVFYDDRLITDEYPKEDPESPEAFLQSLSEVRNFNSWLSDEISVTKDDHILTLSTCVHDNPEERFILCSVLQKEE